MDFENEQQTETLAGGQLSLQPGDALVLKTTHQLDAAECDRLTKHIKALLGVSQILVVGPRAKIAVLRVGTSE